MHRKTNKMKGNELTEQGHWADRRIHLDYGGFFICAGQAVWLVCPGNSGFVNLKEISTKPRIFKS